MDKTIAAALIAAFSTIFVTIIANWDKLRGNRAAASANDKDARTGDLSKSESPSGLPQALQEPWSSKIAGPKEIVQLLLRSAGHAVHVDGFVGPKTTAALIEFQRERDLPLTGLVDEPTGRELDKVREDFKAIQRMLIKIGYPVGVDGLCGNNSMAALKQFQGRHGLTVSGVADEYTKKLLRELSAAK